jgi:hypothetical protein
MPVTWFRQRRKTASMAGVLNTILYLPVVPEVSRM